MILVGFVILCNFLFLEKFYVSQKLKELEEMGEKFEVLWQNEELSELASLIQEMENRYSAVIEFQSANQEKLYSTRRIQPQLNKYNFPYANSVQIRLTTEDMRHFYEGKMVTFQAQNRLSSSQIIGITKQFVNGEVILAHVTVESIQESVALMNQF